MCSPDLRRRFIRAVLVLALLSPPALRAQDDPEPIGDRPTHGAEARAAYKANLASLKGDKDMLVLPGLLANRKTRRIQIAGEATGLAAGSIAEFLLIDQGSDRGYEALLWSFAKPSHVHQALEFVGLKAGQPFNPSKLRFWPKGERVMLTVTPFGDDDAKAGVSLTSLMIDKTTDKTLPDVGFVFTGSYRFKMPGDPETDVYAADRLDPRSVASIYNDPTAVLDVPRRARQREVYGNLIVGPKGGFEAHQYLTLVLEPENKDGRLRVADLTLDIMAPIVDEASGARPPETPLFILRNAAGELQSKTTTLTSVLTVFGRLSEQKRTPYVSVRFGRGLHLARVKKLAKFVAAIDTDRGVRIEPPAAGQLYYQAFLPNKGLLDRENRVFQPWELILSKPEKELVGVLSRHDPVYIDGRRAPDLKTTRHALASSKDLRTRLDDHAKQRKREGRRPGPPVLLIYTAGDLLYGDLMDYIAPALGTHNVIHVFLDGE